MKSVVAPTAWSISLIPRVNARKIPNSSPPFPNFFSPKPYSFFSSPLVRPLSMAASAAQVYHSLNLYELLGFCIHASSSKLMRFFFFFLFACICFCLDLLRLRHPGMSPLMPKSFNWSKIIRLFVSPFFLWWNPKVGFVLALEMLLGWYHKFFWSFKNTYLMVCGQIGHIFFFLVSVLKSGLLLQEKAARLPPLEEIRTVINHSVRGMLSTISQVFHTQLLKISDIMNDLLGEINTSKHFLHASFIWYLFINGFEISIWNQLRWISPKKIKINKGKIEGKKRYRVITRGF